jgi:levansucrase
MGEVAMHGTENGRERVMTWTQMMRMQALLLALAVAALAACDDDDDDDEPELPDARTGTTDGGPMPPVFRDGGAPGDDAGFPPPPPDQVGTAADFVGNFPGEAVTLWPPYTIADIEREDFNTLPELSFDDDPIAEQFWFWDFWPLRNPDGSVAVVDGRVIILGLSAPRAGNVPFDRHRLATWRYFFSSPTGWVDGGRVFPEGTALGDRQWAGSAVLFPDTGEVRFFYSALGQAEALPPGVDSPTNAGDPFEDVSRTGPTIARQLIAETSATLVSDADGIRFVDFGTHEIILDADGEFYATAELARDTGALYVFRDPWYFEDPETELTFLLFSGAAGFQTGPKSGVVGVAVFDESVEEWRLLAPLLAAMDTNSQLERPHFVYRDGRYYLFFSSHEFTFAELRSGPGFTIEDPNDVGPEGLYGFVADNLWGHYRPLNDGGLVAGNPESAPLQLYSFTVLPGGAVTSFVNYFGLGTVTLEEIPQQSEEFQREQFGGTPAEPFFLALDQAAADLDVTEPAAPLPEGTALLVEALQSGGVL